MRVPKPLTNVIESFEKLPGIGPKTAQRLSYYLLHVPQSELDGFADAVSSLKKNTVLCSICKNVAESDPCPICDDSERDQTTIMVVEQPLDLLAIERAGKYNGAYHVLHGVINPLENIGPDEIFIQLLLDRTQKKEAPVQEIIIATNPSMEGNATAMFLVRRVREVEENGRIRDGEEKIRVTRLGMGIPTGADLEYADEMTLTQAIDGRREV